MAWAWADAVAIDGTGLIAAPMQAVRIILTAVPAGLGLVSGEPDLYYDLGYVIWLVGDLAGAPRIIRTLDSIVDGAPRGVTGLAYSFRPFVSGSIAAGWWAPGMALGDGRLAPVGATSADAGWIVLG